MFADKESFKQAYLTKIRETEGITLDEGTLRTKYKTLVLLLKEEMSFNRAPMKSSVTPTKQVYYFSMEFLIGKLLHYYLVNLDIEQMVREGLEDLMINLDDLLMQEVDPGLGNGGLGRLAACFLDSIAFLGIAGHGNGIRYKYGLFEQKIREGAQIEVADNWLKNGYPWEIPRPDKSVIVKFKGNVRTECVQGKLMFYHENYEPVLAVPYDIPVMSYDNLANINNLRLWSAEPLCHELDFACFNRGEFEQAVSLKSEVEAISYILYPDDNSRSGKELRLKQEYFFVAAGLGSIMRSYKKRNQTLADFSRWVAVHINDTHPVLCIPELMRILIDEEGLGWDQAWNITVNTMSFTNHTIMPEAMEKWPIELFKGLLPRIYMIIEEIDREFKARLAKRFLDDWRFIQTTQIIKDGQVYMANLAVIGSSSVNGVAALHTEILKQQVFKDYYRIFGYKFSNKTNGVNHRRFLLASNPGLSELITEAIGPDWKKKAEELNQLQVFKDDASFLAKLAKVKYLNKCQLAKRVMETQGLELDPLSVFDVQVKRIHAYKRQLLNILKIMYLYNQAINDPNSVVSSQTFIFGGKAAPGYHYAKTIIKLINTLANKINRDPSVNQKLKVAFLENFNVSLGELIYPAADISEQISTASKEASGTGNMKFMMNGAITIGTLDGANLEIKEAVGEDNISIFGLTVAEVLNYSSEGGYKSWDHYYSNPDLKLCVDQLVNGFFETAGDEFRVIFDSLLIYNDEFFVLQDFNAYIETYQKLQQFYARKDNWYSTSLINIAKAGVFSSDRTIKEYADQIWKVNTRTL
ncbi:glycogen/starch/alpha-glucan phosphorylase [Desulfosporosinus sp. BICA1-9]|uniref:glycogen/starch/alpha-glucan phosphorylase n=1 Tax=Desulfosporosinus sp. BICA1-9 TaxID=1531958 RepID=UPI00054C03B7|nr:glycogen/starch/alpha-glucan phosphorylase [Desulfosporosinus sp. BICA1-9]KJS48934.1 MAG: maltodextrin phosphorylase [Peptococcaceae bacterium BRH_c23]KJS82983.1 MAG: maltodextrin phosphorylase [Desulfosporosinus sp. BICA1-9]HBW33864.1 glycogen/starch/alpha-glucan phosphorylase [Desulfosporosinus sp.]